MALEGVIINGSSEILKKLITVIGSEISLACGVEDELKKLKQTLEVIAAVTSDAERKQVNDAFVLLWLKRLKEVSYDADDVLDEISYESIRRSDKNNKVKDFFSSSNQVAFRLKMACKIKGINTQFNQIATDMKRFHFETNSSARNGGYEQLNKRQTISYFGDASKFVGREKDQSKIVSLLTTTSILSSSASSVISNQLENVSVVSIVGMGGLGKTSLAQSIYNDKSVEKYFDKKMWVCISDDFDVFKILKNITESATGSRCQDFSNTDVLVEKVKENLEGTKYFLVLDDLWNEDPMEWYKLKSVLDFGSVGSKILVTTRSQIVASVVQGLIPPYNLNVLSEGECWSIIKNKAFSPGGASDIKNMRIIGEKIAKKCGGLPLAANFFGSLMHSQSSERQWLSIRDNESLETPKNHSGGIIPILKLSYDTLPSHLKQCFSYCGLFPKDWVFVKETLIQLWMAEGFIPPPSNVGNQNSLEDIGNDYFLTLLSSSFFQDVERDLYLGDILWFKMHDLVHDLALSILGSHGVTIMKTSEIKNDVSQIRRLRLIMEGKPQEEEFDVLKNATKLRTIFFQGEGFSCPQSNKRLRIIHRLECQDRSLKNLTSTLKFKHMRYLDLSYCSLEDVHAESINQLYNLQTLCLYKSKNVQNIVKGIGSLINLRHLNLSFSDAKDLPDSAMTTLTSLKTLYINSCEGITVLPTNIGRLQSLSSLGIINTKISELPDSISLLCNLTNFHFMSCHQLKSLPSNFGALTQLRSLNLFDTKIEELPESMTNNICKLEFVIFETMCKFPKDIKNWVELRHLEHNEKSKYSSMPGGIEKLICLEVLNPFIVNEEEDISNIQKLADLTSLRKLVILNLENVRGGKLEAEKAKLKDKQNIRSLSLRWKNFLEEEEVVVNISFLVLEGLQPHPNLKELFIHGFPGLKLPKWMRSSVCLPNLVELKFYDCESCTKLVGLGQLPCLQILQIERMNSVKCLGKEFYYHQQEEEEIKGFATTATTARTLFPSLTRLFIMFCKNLEEWSAPSPPDNSFPFLEKVAICGCGNLTSIPDLRSCTSSLAELSIEGCQNL